MEDAGNRIAIFLRGINLGGRRLKAHELAAPFRKAGFRGVETYLASGNVVMEDPGLDPTRLEDEVEERFAREAGFRADAFARSLSSLAAMVESPVIRQGEAEGLTPHILLLKEPLPDPALRAVAELQTPDDRFEELDRELVWLRRGHLSASTIQHGHLERALGGAPNTMRKVTTLRRMVGKFGPPPGRPRPA